MEQQVLYDIPTFCRICAISRSRTYEEIAAGRLEIIKIGKLTRISREAVARWLELCQAETRQGRAA